MLIRHIENRFIHERVHMDVLRSHQHMLGQMILDLLNADLNDRQVAVLGRRVTDGCEGANLPAPGAQPRRCSKASVANRWDGDLATSPSESGGRPTTRMSPPPFVAQDPESSAPRRNLHEHLIAKFLEVDPDESANVVAVHRPVRDPSSDCLDRDSEHVRSNGE